MGKTILVGDIGSTKSSWWYLSEVPTEINLPGFNPVVHTSEQGSSMLEALQMRTSGETISAVWYYGAGIVDPHLAGLVRESIQKIFPDCPVHVASDLVGAAFASSGNAEGSVAILGTGSHAAVWDGQKIARQATSLGYILGDEGSGCDIGKSLVQSYFYHDMPLEIMDQMKRQLQDGRVGLFNTLYTSSTPNQYLAEFARTAVLFQEHPWIKQLVASRFDLFVKRHVVPLDPPGEVHIVGSIGCIFASLIKQELGKYGLTPGFFIKDPARRLFERHLHHE